MNIAKSVANKKFLLTFAPTVIKCSSLHATALLCKSQAGKHKISKFNTKPLTYDQAMKPDAIGWKKSHLTFHTGNLHGEEGAYQLMYEDKFIRNFIMGTFYRMISGIVIKRRFNIVDVIATSDVSVPPGGYRMDFLIGYSERLLSAYLKCVVKIHMVKISVDNSHYKYI
uniref:28S ribosomal protein S24, mitochondrial n=1 Tax=Phallusia mammillata TaxID=59560 RepID=A0A6F9DKN2_9ASCI|nr:28S ribosomal protein S24, mitochondrial [Phallusia mammillata]